MEEKVVRKTTAKKTVRRTPSRTVFARTADPISTAVSTRKAPARVGAYGAKQNQFSFKVFFIVLLLFCVLLWVSALIGFSDKGQLDVAGKIAERKQNASPEDNQAALDAVNTSPAQSLPTASSLVGMGKDENTPQANSPVSTSTDATASSTSQTATTTVPTADATTAGEPQKTAQ